MGVVAFSDHQSADGLTVYSANVGDFVWKNRLVGITNSGFLYVDERSSMGRYYELSPKLLPWVQIREVITTRHISIRGILGGLVLLGFAYCIFDAGWIRQTHTGRGIYIIPVLCGGFGLVLLLGAIRNRIVVTTNERRFQWISLPLAYNKTLSICYEAARKAQSYGVQLVHTHAAEDKIEV